jgi:hypothetical protein
MGVRYARACPWSATVWAASEIRTVWHGGDLLLDIGGSPVRGR